MPVERASRIIQSSTRFGVDHSLECLEITAGAEIQFIELHPESDITLDHIGLRKLQIQSGFHFQAGVKAR